MDMIERLRFPTETIILWITLVIIVTAIGLTSAATFCVSGLILVLIVAYAYFINRSHHQALMENAIRVNQDTSPEMLQIVEHCEDRIQPGTPEVYVVRSDERNAYTFGMGNPKAIVIYSSLLEQMDADELAFVIGHEMGHIRLGHTWLNSILGGMAGIPLPTGAIVIFTFAFRWWNRACEYSADRAGVLACNKPEKAITALLKIVSGARTLNSQQTNLLIAHVDREDDDLSGQLSELLMDHPLVIKRIEQIKTFAVSSEYAWLVKNKK